MLTQEGKAACLAAGIDPKRIKELQMEGRHPDEVGSFFDLPNTTKRIFINPGDMDFVCQLRKLPASTRVDILDLTDVELEKHFAKRRQLTRKRLVEVLEQQYHWRESGDPADIEGGVLPGTHLGQRELLLELKTGLRLKRPVMQAIIDWFTSEYNRDVYIKEQHDDEA